MTNHDRMMAVYRNQLPDVIPVGIYAKQFPRGYDERKFRSMGLGMIDYYPVTSMMGPPYRMGPGFLSEIKGAEFTVRHIWENGEHIELKTYKTKVGTVSQRVRKDPMYSSDWVVKDYIEKPEDYKIVQFLIENSVIRNNAKPLAQKMKEMGNDGVILGRIDRSPFQKVLIELANPEIFLMDIITGVAYAEELLEAMAHKYADILKWIPETPAEVVWQTENLSGDLTSPSLFEKYCLPLYNKITTCFDRKEKPFVVHTDGRMKPLLDLIAKSPFDACESFSYPEMGNDVTFTQAQQTWPGKVILPNWPASLCYESRKTIDAFLALKLEEVGLDKPYMIQFSEDVPMEHFSKTARAILDFMNENAVSK
ncbi:MAG: hypothetical protein JXD22_08405 [Sedimentisphaerales bacterium]|nr:hypothetical protein [Sedimentisphaerales bacterium]